MMKSSKIKFESRVRKIGNSFYLLIPIPVRKHLEIEDGEKILMQIENGQFGNYASFWSSKQQKSE